ncbi:MAG: MFS transporter [Deltaproteobacteria bacterium]|nr:MFS transporter [Deltaproteobacteria bacterium]
MSPTEPSAAAPGPLTGYQRRLFVFLSVATFFEGYDFIALTQLLPNLRADMRLSEAAAGVLVAVINFGTVLAYLLVRRADRWGRRRLMAVTIAGYALFTFASGLAPGAASFGVFQLLARMFLIAEWATSMVYAAEEFPADRRGMVIGVIQGCSSLGAIACAGLAPLLLRTAWGWRTVYLVGVVPLLLLAYARRGLRESRRFAAEVGEQGPERSLWHLWRTPYRRRMIELALIWAVTYVGTNNAVTFWKEFAVHERGLSDAQVGLAITVAALVSMPMVFYAGTLLDRIGRRPGAAVIFGLTAFGVFGSYTAREPWLLTAALVLGIFGASAVLPVLNAYTTELFPTALRGAAFAWSNNLLGRIGYVLSPLAIGLAAGRVGWGTSLRATALAPIVALVLIFALLPETRHKELEQTAAL